MVDELELIRRILVGSLVFELALLFGVCPQPTRPLATKETMCVRRTLVVGKPQMVVSDV